MKTEVTAHAIYRARLRWLELTDADAVRAIRFVVQHGESRVGNDCIIYQRGNRCVRVKNGKAVTVMLSRPKRLKFVRKQVRRDFKERTGRS